MAGASIVTGLFTCAAAGVLAALLLAPFAELRRFFFAFNAGTGLLFLALGAFFRTPPGSPAPASWDPAGLAYVAVMVAMAATIAYIGALYLPGARPRRAPLLGAVAAAATAVALDGWTAAGVGAGPAWAFGANAFAAAGLLGSVIVAMILGHWYLVRWKLPVDHLVRYARLLAGALGVRMALLLLGLGAAGLASERGLSGYLHGVAVERGFFFWQRIFFGLLGPAVFAYMVHETARIRSTQSATGILYITVIFVLYGELLARYLTVAGAGPM
ncbi:MAG: hypothetical protein ACRD5D_00825 [Candidatus Polarisedimenticolia bacterium]